MNRFVDVIYRDKNARLFFSMNVMLDVTEEFEKTVPELLEGTEREVFERQCWLASRMSIEGKTIWSNMELDTITLSDLGSITPGEMSVLSNKIVEAINLGYKTEIEPPVVDETLLELKKKRSRKDSKEQKS